MAENQKRNTGWYPYDRLGHLYVHTNYNSFMSNMGSFGDVNGNALISKAKYFVDMQEQREEKINTILKKLIGPDASIERMVADYKILMERYRKIPQKAWQSDPLVLIDGMKMNHDEGLLYALTSVDKAGKMMWATKEKAAKSVQTMQSFLDGINSAWEFLLTEGWSLEDLSKESLENKLAKFQEGVSAETEAKPMSEKIIQSHVYSIKGDVFVKYAVIIKMLLLNSFSSIGKNTPNDMFKMTIEGPGKTSDITVELLKNITYGVSVKSASAKTFAGSHGIGVFNGTLNSVMNILEEQAPEAKDTLNFLRYYYMNVARMKSTGMTEQGSSSIDLLPQANQAMINLLRTYATMYIGGSGKGDLGAASLAGDLREVDVLIGYDFAYAKSQILRSLLVGLLSGKSQDFSVMLTLDKAPSSWESFDIAKQYIMFFTNGNYDSVSESPYMESAVKSAKSASLKISLRMLAGQHNLYAKY